MASLKLLFGKHVCEQSQTPTGCSLCGSGGFISGTPILTERGWRKVETLRPGTGLSTLGHGVQQLQRVTQRTLWLDPVDCPDCVRPLYVPAGAIGNDSPFTMPPDNRVALRSEMLAKARGQPYGLVHAGDLCDFAGIGRQAPPRRAEVFQLHFESEEVVFVQGGAALLCPREKDFLDMFPEPGAQTAECGTFPKLTQEDADAVILCIEDDMRRTGQTWLPPVLDEPCCRNIA